MATAEASSATKRYLARVTIELTTPFAVRTGEGGFLEDTAFVLDANGVPAIPGSSIAGVLRHAADRAGMASVEDLFGYQPTATDPSRTSVGQGSRLTVSWAKTHASDNSPVDGRLPPESPQLADPVLRTVAQGVLRDHVRINHRGVAAETGKYDERLVPAGARFSFDLRLSGWDADSKAWEHLLALLANGDLRLGGGARRGFGAFRVVALHARCFDLTNPADFDAFAACPSRIDVPTGLPAHEPKGTPEGRSNAVVLQNLRVDGAWLFGGGAPEPMVDDTGNREVDIAPMREARITWSGDHGVVSSPHALIPASSIKGALAHRVAWHFNRLQRRWADVTDGDGAPTYANVENEAVRAVFGHVPDRGTDTRGRPGCVTLSDIYLSRDDGGERRETRHHVALDRYTGGARNQALYQENVVPRMHLCEAYPITIAPDVSQLDAPVRHALGRALLDLKHGRMAFGAGGNRGYGAFTCDAIDGDRDLLRALGMETVA